MTKKTSITLEEDYLELRPKCKDGAIFCKAFPPIMNSQEEVDLLTDTAEDLGDAISGVVASNLFLGIFLTGIISQLLGVVGLLQVLLLQAVM